MKTDILSALIALKLIAEYASFTEVSKKMGVSPSAISQTIKQLEKNLDCILVNRTTRSVSLTEIGENFLNQYKNGLVQVMNAIEELGNFTGKPTGTLRLNLPKSSWLTVIKPILSGFQKQYPEIILELYFEETLVDIVSKGFDAGIRPSEMTAGDMTAIMISPPFKYVVAGSPNYFKKNAIPKHPKDLLNHNCLSYRFSSGIYKRWEFKENNREFSIETKGNMIINDPLIMLDCALKDIGLIYTTDILIEDLLNEGKLKIILEEFAPYSDGYYLYYPSISQVSPKLRAFIDYIKLNKTFF